MSRGHRLGQLPGASQLTQHLLGGLLSMLLIVRSKARGLPRERQEAGDALDGHTYTLAEPRHGVTSISGAELQAP